MRPIFQILSFLILIAAISSDQSVYGQSLPEKKQQKAEKYKAALSQYQQEGKERKELEYLNKLAFLYWNHDFREQARSYFSRGLAINQGLGNTNGIKRTHYYLGMIWSESGRYKKALGSFEKGLQISKRLSQKSSQLSGLINIAQTHQLAGDYQSSNRYALQGLSLAKELDKLKPIRTCYGILSENHKKLGHSEKSIKYFDLFSSIDQHLKKEKISEIRKHSQSEISEARSEKQQTQQELTEEINKRKMTEDSLQRVDSISRKRQMQLTMQELENKKIQAQLKLEKTVRNSLIIGFLLITGFSLLLYRFYKQKKQANVLLERQNQQINQQKIQIQQQKDRLQLQNTKLNDSLNYAETIQQAILPAKNELEQMFESFILYKPKDIVSGDFYWYTRVEGTNAHPSKAFLAAVDCTGHGVPGAFMSMIGNRIFNEIIGEKKIYDPAHILYHMNRTTIDALQQERTDNPDGMDVCLISMENTDKQKKKIRFAGAKRPLFYYRQNEPTLSKIKGDRYSIGGINKNKTKKTFQTHELTLQKGDMMYLTTDGLFDQVNDHRKRFSTQRFIQVMYDNLHLDMKTQKKKLEEKLETFTGVSEQRDDITVVAVKIL